MDIFVGSLSFKLKESELREAFEKYGNVSSAKIIIDKITRQSKGFGFVEMPDEVEARAAINALNGADMYGRPLVVNESQKREPRADGGTPRGDFRKEGFNRPRPAGNDTGSYWGNTTDNRPARVVKDDDEPDDDDSPAKIERPAAPDRGAFTGGGGFRNAPKQRDRGHSSHDKGHGDRNHGGKPSRFEDRYTKKGGGGSKDFGRRLGEDDDW